jgi:hypothetical protein
MESKSQSPVDSREGIYFITDETRNFLMLDQIYIFLHDVKNNLKNGYHGSY